MQEDKTRVYVCQKCGEPETIRYPRQSVRCRLCGGRMHKTEKKI